MPVELRKAQGQVTISPFAVTVHEPGCFVFEVIYINF